MCLLEASKCYRLQRKNILRNNTVTETCFRTLKGQYSVRRRLCLGYNTMKPNLIESSD